MNKKSNFEKALFDIQVAVSESVETSMLTSLEFKFTGHNIMTVWIHNITKREFNNVLDRLVRQQWLVMTQEGILSHNNEYGTLTDVNIILRYKS